MQFVPITEATTLLSDGVAHPVPWNGATTDPFADADLDFDPQAFFNDYMYSGIPPPLRT